AGPPHQHRGVSHRASRIRGDPGRSGGSPVHGAVRNARPTRGSPPRPGHAQGTRRGDGVMPGDGPGTTSVRRRGLEPALVCVAALWGATFVTVKNAVAHVPVFEFLALRYALAGVALTAVFWRQAAGLGREGLRGGLIAGAFLFAGYAAQTIGIQYTQASNAAFVTGLFVVIAPVLS